MRAADLLDQMLRRYPEQRELARDILICEQEGDRITHDLIQRLNQTFVTPIDREDILELASALDDIVDFTEEVADYLGLYKIEAPMEQAQRLAHILLQACAPDRRGDAAAARLQDISHYTVEINRLENDGDRIVREAIASLFEGGIDPMVVIRWKDIFERLEDAIDATSSVANIARGHRHQERLTADGQRRHPRDRRRHRAGVRLHQRLPRHRQRVATSISTRAMSPRVAVALAAMLNFAGAFISLKVAATVGQGHRRPRRGHDDGRVRRAGRARSPGTSSPGTSGCRRARRTR